MGNTAKPTAAKGVILAVLERADRAFRTSLSLRAQSGRVVEVRQAYLSIAFIRAFQTALGQGSSAVTAAATSAISTFLAPTMLTIQTPRSPSPFAASVLTDWLAMKWIGRVCRRPL
jgi:hypothetical protein